MKAHLRATRFCELSKSGHYYHDNQWKVLSSEPLGENCIMFFTLWDLWKWTCAILWLSLKLVNLLRFQLITLPGPAPAPSNSFKGTHPQTPNHVQMRHQDNEPLLSIQHIWSDFFLQEPTSPRVWTWIWVSVFKWKLPYLSDHILLSFYWNKNTFLFHLGNTHIYHPLPPPPAPSFSQSIY